MRLGTWIGIGLFALTGAGCGGGGSSKPASYSEVMSNITHPTGTLAPTNADAVAKAYQTSLAAGTGPAGQRLDQKTSAVLASSPCTVSGTISVDAAQMSGNAISESFTYNNCCETADCCFNGPANIFYSTTAGATSLCESAQITATCSGMPITENYSFCSDGAGTFNYLVEVDGESFAVSGSYSAGNGMLTIIGKNGTFSCTYTNDTGSCTGTTGTFTF